MVIDELGPGCQRAEALGLLGTIVYEGEDFGRSIEILEQALREAGDDIRLRCDRRVRAGLRAHPFRERRCRDGAHRDTRWTRPNASPMTGCWPSCLAAWVLLRVMQGDEVDTARLERALALEDVDRRGHALHWPSFNAAAIRVWRHDVERRPHGARRGVRAVHGARRRE